MGLRDWFRSGPAGEDPELEALASQAADLRALVEASERDLAASELESRLFGEATRRFRPGMDLPTAGETLLDILQEPLELSTFFVAKIDFEADLFAFPVFFEGGRVRKHASSPYSQGKGITGRTLESGHPLYIRDMIPEGVALGAMLSKAEEITGLIAQTWYGVPLGLPEQKPRVLVAFQVFPRDGFSEQRRAFLQRMTRLLALAAREEL